MNEPAPYPPHVLVVDDDARLRSLLARFLSTNGFMVSVAADAAEARRHLAALQFDILVIDVMMPGESGLALTKSIRADGTGGNVAVPILMLTAMGETRDRIAGLEQGVDDYMAKPFEPRELSLRISAILKRAQPAPTPPPAETLRFGPFVYHVGRGELRRGEEIVHLTDRERDMLRLLAVAPGETVPRLALASDAASASERAVDVQINRLRRKIESDPTNPLIVQTVRGVGYRLVVST